MRYQVDYCSKCGYKRNIINKKHWLCAVCNHERLHGTSFSTRQGTQQPLKRTPLKKTRKKTGELDVFNQIWEQREHISELSERGLEEFKNTDFYPNLFAHVLDKNKYSKFRLRKDNILLVHPEEHNLIDQGTEEQRRAYEKKWRMSFQKFYDKQRELKNLYSKII